MRHDVKIGVEIHMNDEVKPAYAKLARKLDCDPRTVKRYFENKPTKPRKKQPGKLDAYTAIIDNKLELDCSASAIFHFIKTKGYSGGYTLVREYCRTKIKSSIQKATVRVETTPGLSAQVDWKEDMRIMNRQNEPFVINIFLYILSFSRFKYIELTLDRRQTTLFSCMNNAFTYSEGVPQEIWFDNMRTVVDKPRIASSPPVFHKTFHAYTKDAGFHPIACRPYRPQTKGKVEALARVMNRLYAYNNEFDTLEELQTIINKLNVSLNSELSQATRRRPIDDWQKEKEYLRDFNHGLLHGYADTIIERKVSKEAMVVYENRKYSLPTRFIGKTVELVVSANNLYIYYNQECIKTHRLSQRSFNYDKDDLIEILRSDVLKHRSDEEIEGFIESNIHIYDQL